MAFRLTNRTRRTLAVIPLMLLLAVPAAASRGSPPSSFCVLSVEEGGQLAMLEPGGRIRLKLPLGERPHEIEVTPDGRTAYVSMFGITDYDSRIGTPGNRIAEIDLVRGRVTGSLLTPHGLTGPHGLKLRPGHPRELFVNTEVGGDTMLVFDRRSRRVLRRFPLPKATHNFVFARKGEALFSFAGANGVARIDAVSGRQSAHVDVGSPVRGLAVMTNGNVLAAAKGEVIELRAANLAIVRRLKAPRDGQYVYLTQLPDGTIVAPSLGDDGIAWFDRGRLPARFIATGKAALSARLGPDGLIYVANVDDDHLTVLDRHGTVKRALGGLASPNGLAFGACPRV